MNTIVLIGPIGVGKSTQAKLLADRLEMPRCSYDEVKSAYWKIQGLNRDKAHQIEKEHGLYAMLSYMNTFKAETVCSIINDYPGHVIDFGGGAQTFDEQHQIDAVRKIFDPIANVFLLLPSPDLATSIKALPGLKENYPINAYLIMHPTNELFAKHTVYTLDKSQDDISNEIIDKLQVN